MKARSTIMVCAAIMLGFLLGVLCRDQTAVKAQSDLQVYVVRQTETDMVKKGPTSIPGRQIVGFSCSLEHYANEVFCFTAYVK